MGESPMLSDIFRRSCAFRGAMRDTVGLRSSDINVITSFIGFNALTASSAFVTSVSVWVHRSDSPYLTSGDGKVAQIAGCCSKNLSTMSHVLFHLVATSVTSLWFFRPRHCLTVVLWWKNVDIRLTLPRSLENVATLNTRWDARFSVYTKHFPCGNFPTWAAMIMFDALPWQALHLSSDSCHSSTTWERSSCQMSTRVRFKQLSFAEHVIKSASPR